MQLTVGISLLILWLGVTECHHDDLTSPARSLDNQDGGHEKMARTSVGDVSNLTLTDSKARHLTPEFVYQGSRPFSYLPFTSLRTTNGKIEQSRFKRSVPIINPWLIYSRCVRNADSQPPFIELLPCLEMYRLKGQYPSHRVIRRSTLAYSPSDSNTAKSPFLDKKQATSFLTMDTPALPQKTNSFNPPDRPARNCCKLMNERNHAGQKIVDIPVSNQQEPAEKDPCCDDSQIQKDKGKDIPADTHDHFVSTKENPDTSILGIPNHVTNDDSNVAIIHQSGDQIFKSFIPPIRKKRDNTFDDFVEKTGGYFDQEYYQSDTGITNDRKEVEAEATERQFIQTEKNEGRNGKRNIVLKNTNDHEIYNDYFTDDNNFASDNSKDDGSEEKTDRTRIMLSVENDISRSQENNDDKDYNNEEYYTDDNLHELDKSEVGDSDERARYMLPISADIRKPIISSEENSDDKDDSSEESYRMKFIRPYQRRLLSHSRRRTQRNQDVSDVYISAKLNPQDRQTLSRQWGRITNARSSPSRPHRRYKHRK